MPREVNMKLRLFAAILGLTFATAVMAGKQDVTVVNKTGKPIHHVYISDEKTDDWEEDVLGDDVLQPGQSVKVTFDNNNKACIWDFKAVDADGKEYLLMKANLCQLNTINIK